MYARGGPRPEPGTLNRLFFEAVVQYDKPDAMLVRAGERYTPRSHRTLLDRIRHASYGLKAIGIQRGARVAILPSATVASVTTAVANTMTAAGFTSDKYAMTITTGGTTVTNLSTVTTGTAIKVQVSATWSVIGLRPMGMISASKQVVGFTIMVKE